MPTLHVPFFKWVSCVLASYSESLVFHLVEVIGSGAPASNLLAFREVQFSSPKSVGSISTVNYIYVVIVAQRPNGDEVRVQG